ncbi:MAG TPA: hypothetical protein VHZ26_11985 [Caulobacteraceae bacterium]|nr:hypothetical protein [Caulobacteraceae bacterium]
MAAITRGVFSAKPGADRNAFLLLVGLVWVAVLSGFGTDSFDHVSRHGLDYPLIVHFHAVAFVGWLALFTTQVALIRAGRADIHRRLGMAGAVLAAAMVVLGPATALIVDAQAYVKHGETPEFLGVQLTDIIAFVGLTTAGLLLRGASPAHKRLMLLGLIYISDAGFARFVNPILAAPLGQGEIGRFAQLYLGSDLLLLGLGAYDLVTRRKLHPAYIAGAAWSLALQLTALALLQSPGWKAVTLRLIGH